MNRLAVYCVGGVGYTDENDFYYFLFRYLNLFEIQIVTFETKKRWTELNISFKFLLLLQVMRRILNTFSVFSLFASQTDLLSRLDDWRDQYKFIHY